MIFSAAQIINDKSRSLLEGPVDRYLCFISQMFDKEEEEVQKLLISWSGYVKRTLLYNFTIFIY